MQCPECGYAMGEFDVDCKRCEQMGKAAVTRKAAAVEEEEAPEPAAEPGTGWAIQQEAPQPQQPGTTIVQVQQVVPERVRPQSGPGSPIGLYILAVLFPLIGIIWGIVWWTGGDTDEKRAWGQTGFWIAIAVWVVTALLIFGLGQS